ncbi:DJ-1/PfpI family protein [Streptomyces sp. Je 1-332]|uniref:DJ-1/PfpI family protein n=1 Tax=Streptomyces sp. Je 1-332 TaxID=3231270 RepID=UPI0034599DEF
MSGPAASGAVLGGAPVGKSDREPKAGADRRRLLRGAVAGTLGAAGLASASVHPARAAERGAPGQDGATPVSVAVLLYDGFTALDAVGPYEVLCRVPGVRVTMVARRAGPVRTDTGELTLVAERAMGDVDRADVLLVPGGGNRGTVARWRTPTPTGGSGASTATPHGPPRSAPAP